MLYKHQFCLSSRPILPQIDCTMVEIGDYTLHYQNDLSFCQSQSPEIDLYLLGEIFSYESPEQTNQDIINSLAQITTARSIFEALAPYCGAFILLIKTKNDLWIIPDAAAQREVFYNEDASYIASQVGLFPEVHLDQLPEHPYYSSALFDQKRIYIDDSTPVETIKRILPNHFLSTLTLKCERFFPTVQRKPQPIAVVAPKAAAMLQGFIKAINHRHELVIPVTAGFDSRMLFLASLPLAAEYYISQHEGMPDDHYEITTARKVVTLFERELTVVKDGPEDCHFATAPHGVDFPRDMSFPKLARGKVVINGNVSEVARNHYKYHKPTGQKLAHLAHYGNQPWVANTYQQWLRKNASLLKSLGYDPLDFFYWEENMANWAAKGKSETRAMDVEMISPFNSRALLQLLHSTNRNDRDTTSNTLHAIIIKHLTDYHEKLSEIKINPDFERNRARFLWKLGLFKVFDRTRLQLKILKSRFMKS